MPEEHNRIIADHLSDLCLAATDLNVTNLSSEGIDGTRVILSGNPIVDAVERLMPSVDDQAKLLASFDLDKDSFVLATFHRPENVDDIETLSTVLDALVAIGQPVLLPLHPRTQQRISDFDLDRRAASIRIVDPIGYRDFLGLGANARLLVSDSGGVQEEVSVYKKPAVVVRRSTERQEVEGTFVTRIEPTADLPNALISAWDTATDKTRTLKSIPSP
jgi:UDP-N-acetylglucosamine 2-epimerase (non-hydrolysing)